jgi:hypothetical protein
MAGATLRRLGGTIMHPPTYTGIGEVLKITLKTEGPRGLYKGLTPSSENVEGVDNRGAKSSTHSTNCTCCEVAEWYVILMTRTRLQTQGTIMHPPTYTGIGEVLKITLKTEGPRGLARRKWK